MGTIYGKRLCQVQRHGLAHCCVNMAEPRKELLERCQEFLLHPTVRSLSLAQRVDFLEQKVRA